MPEQEEGIDRHRSTKNSLKCETLCNVKHVSYIAYRAQKYSLVHCECERSAYTNYDKLALIYNITTPLLCTFKAMHCTPDGRKS